jgi:hypothetical protein
VDTPLFTINHQGSITSLLVYVDDFLLTGKYPSFLQNIKDQLHNKFSIKDLGPIHYYLGIEVLRNSSSLTMSQRKYALDLLKYADTLDLKPVATPMDPVIKLNDTDGEVLKDPTLYRTIVGKLIYLTITRPDLSFAAQALSQYSHCPRTSHFATLQRVLRYIKLCPGQGVFFPAANTLELTTYCDSDWASCSVIRRSVFGYAIFLGKTPISWQSKKQAVVSRSFTEAEYRALADSTCEVSWLKCLLHDLGIHIPTPSLVMCDNVSTIALANNPVQHAMTKHIDIDCHFVRDKIRSGQIKPIFVPSHAQVADILTKGLSKYLHYRCLSKLSIYDPYTVPTCCEVDP